MTELAEWYEKQNTELAFFQLRGYRRRFSDL